MAADIGQAIVEAAVAAQFDVPRFTLHLEVEFTKNGDALFENDNGSVIQYPSIQLIMYNGVDRATCFRIKPPTLFDHDPFCRSTYRFNSASVEMIATLLSDVFIDLHSNARILFGNDYGVDGPAPLMIEFKLGRRVVNGDVSSFYMISHRAIPYIDGMNLQPYITFLLQLLKSSHEIVVEEEED